jgi:hypothetical protein
VTDAEIRRRRLARQKLGGQGLGSPAEVVRWLGAVQAQDYRGALWGIAQRTRGASEADVERAIAERRVVRSWPMRRTLHLVAAGDLRWMLRHLASRMIRGMAGRWRQLGLEAADLARAGRLIERALEGGRQLTRAEIYQALAVGGVSPAGQRGIHLVSALAMQGLVCFGPHRGKQPTFVLLEEWLPAAPVLERDEAMAELALRYVASHGPATAADLAWWAGLPLGEARRAIEAARPRVAVRDGYAIAASGPRAGRAAPSAHLLPPWDEYTVAYRDRSAIVDPAVAESVRGGIFAPVVVLDGRVAGTWRRRISRRAVEITAELIEPPGAAHRRALAAAAERLGAFCGQPAALTTTTRRRARAGSPRRARRS